VPVHVEAVLRVNAGNGGLDELGMPGVIEIQGRVFNLELRREYPCKLLFANRQPLDEKRLQGFFDRIGSTRFELRSFNAVIPAGVFVPAAQVNDARRRFFEDLDAAVLEARKMSRRKATEDICAEPATNKAPAGATSMSALVDRAEYIKALPLDALDEVVLDLANGTKDQLLDAWEDWGPKLRFAVPTIVRAWNAPMIAAKLQTLFRLGARRFQVSGFGGLELVAWAGGLDRKRLVDTAQLMNRTRSVRTRQRVAIHEPHLPDFRASGIDVTADWPCYTMSRESARSWLEQGISRVTLSVEDGRENLSELLREFGPAADVVVYQSTPLFTAESCVYANMLGHCPGKAACDFKQMEMTAPDGAKFLAVDHWCRTIVLNQQPYSLSSRISELQQLGARRFRVDFIHRRYEPEQITAITKAALDGKGIPETHEGNWDRGLQ
jgi:U32 family peptidase